MQRDKRKNWKERDEWEVVVCKCLFFLSFIYLLKWSKILFVTILINKIIFILLTFISIIIIITFTVRFSYMYINMYVDFKFKTGLLLKLRAHIKTCCCISSYVSLFWGLGAGNGLLQEIHY